MIKITLIRKQIYFDDLHCIPGPLFVKPHRKNQHSASGRMPTTDNYDVNMDVVCERQDTATHG